MSAAFPPRWAGPRAARHARRGTVTTGPPREAGPAASGAGGAWDGGRRALELLRTDIERGTVSPSEAAARVRAIARAAPPGEAPCATVRELDEVLRSLLP
jgi:hypothetical protein